MTTPSLTAPPSGYTTIPSPSTPNTALPSTARPMTAGTSQTGTSQGTAAATMQSARVYQPERTRKGRIFPDEMVRERMQQMCECGREGQSEERIGRVEREYEAPQAKRVRGRRRVAENHSKSRPAGDKTRGRRGMAERDSKGARTSRGGRTVDNLSRAVQSIIGDNRELCDQRHCRRVILVVFSHVNPANAQSYAQYLEKEFAALLAEHVVINRDRKACAGIPSSIWLELRDWTNARFSLHEEPVLEEKHSRQIVTVLQRRNRNDAYRDHLLTLASKVTAQGFHHQTRCVQHSMPTQPSPNICASSSTTPLKSKITA